MGHFDSLTDHARDVHGDALLAARSYGHDQIAPAHLLLGILEVPGRALRVFWDLGVDPGDVRAKVEELGGFPRRRWPRDGGKLPVGDDTQRAVRAAAEKAAALGHDRTGTAHLLLGLLVADDPLAARALKELSVTSEAVRAQLAGARPPSRTQRNLGFDKAFDALLHRRAPAWCVVGTDRARLVAACRDYLTPERLSAEAMDTTGASRATYILDRLLPVDEIDIFRRLNSHERWLYTLYPLFRRSPADFDSVTPDRWMHGENAAVEAAWVDTRSTNDELLGWQTECDRRGWPARSWHNRLASLAVIEYGRRTPDLDRMVGYLGGALPREAHALLHTAMRLVADSVPRTKAPEEHVTGRLKEAGFAALAEAVAKWTKPGPAVVDTGLTGMTRNPFWESELAKTLWLAQQGPADVDHVIEAELPFTAWRLAEIVPRDRGDVWDRILGSFRFDDEATMLAFCQWCTPPDRHRLVPYFDHQDIEWAAAALETWLALAPREEAARLAEEAGLPAWQSYVLDRWLHAPPELRPLRPRTRCSWEIAFDLRRHDAFDVRQALEGWHH